MFRKNETQKSDVKSIIINTNRNDYNQTPVTATPSLLIQLQAT